MYLASGQNWHNSPYTASGERKLNKDSTIRLNSTHNSDLAQELPTLHISNKFSSQISVNNIIGEEYDARISKKSKFAE